MIFDIAKLILTYAVQYSPTAGDAGQVLRVVPYECAPDVLRAGLAAHTLDFAYQFSSAEQGDEAIWDMRHGIASGAKRHIDVYHRTTVEGIAVLGLALSLPPQRLASLRFWSAGLGDDGVQALAPLLSPSIKLLVLSRNEICDRGAQALAAHMPRSLQYLELETNRVGESGAQSLLGPTLPRSLVYLHLSFNKVGRAGARALAANMPPSLSELSLSCNDLGDEGAEAIAASLPPSMVKLDLSFNEIGDAGALALAANLPVSLLVLHLAGNVIGDAGANALVAGVAPSSVRQLQLTQNRITQPVRAALQQAWTKRGGTTRSF
ncbi:hypothetical protein BC828DRAFT_379563 [Blastocladiella britannica]|nr:hypothetical protein BC828DRAFT_379563 [Blastocladiella britannica]